MHLFCAHFYSAASTVNDARCLAINPTVPASARGWHQATRRRITCIFSLLWQAGNRILQNLLSIGRWWAAKHTGSTRTGRRRQQPPPSPALPPCQSPCQSPFCAILAALGPGSPAALHVLCCARAIASRAPAGRASLHTESCAQPGPSLTFLHATLPFPLPTSTPRRLSALPSSPAHGCSDTAHPQGSRQGHKASC